VKYDRAIRRVASEIEKAIDVLNERISVNADDGEARRRVAVLLLSLHGWTPRRRLLTQARDELVRALDRRPKDARSHALLGYVYDLRGEGTRALACFRQARRLKPRDRVYDVYVLTLLVTHGSRKKTLAEIRAAALRHQVDLVRLRRDLRAAGLRPDAEALLSNGFIRARNFFKSSLADEAEGILNALEPRRARAQATAERKRCAGDQRALRRSFDASRVPLPLRALTQWASRYGVGDDACRGYLLERVAKKTRATLISQVDAHAQAIQSWLDSFGGRSMPPEAAAFMYLALGVEEIRGNG
jgi:tetratricopeptide (TPR) repeat protein